MKIEYALASFYSCYLHMSSFIFVFFSFLQFKIQLDWLKNFDLSSDKDGLEYQLPRSWQENGGWGLSMVVYWRRGRDNADNGDSPILGADTCSQQSPGDRGRTSEMLKMDKDDLKVKTFLRI